MTDDPPATWDLLVVGGGTAGLVAAKTAARLGARVVLVESDRTGGDCLWTGCVPSKSLLAAAGAAATARGAARLGVHVDGVRVDLAAVMAHVRAAVRTIEPVDSPESLTAEGVTVLAGRARFTGPATAVVTGGDDEVPVRFHQAVLATGAAPSLPDVPGLADLTGGGHLTSETVWDLDALPARLAVLGGGSIGCELGQAFARLGSAVTLVEAGERLLPREDPDAAAAVARALAADGVTVLTGASATRVEAAAAGGLLHLDGDDPVAFDRLLVAVGRTPRTADLDLDRAGVRLDERGFVVVDDHLRTTSSRIWAAGDLTGHPQLTHLAGVHGSLAGSNAVLGLRRSVGRTGVPRVTFTQPEVAAVGLTTGTPHDGLHEVTVPHADVDRAVAEADTDGFTRIVVDRRGRVRGATVVGPRAGESLGELAVAVGRGLRTRDLAAVTHPYPSWNDGPWKAALADLRERLERPAPRRAGRALVVGRRWWRERTS